MSRRPNKVLRVDPDAPVVFRLAPEQYDAFVAAINAPPRPNPRLEALIKQPSVLEEKEDETDSAGGPTG